MSDTVSDVLLEEAAIVFLPQAGSIDVAAVAARIAGLGPWFRDEAEPDRYVVAPTEAARDAFAAERRDDPDAGFPHALLVRLDPERVVVVPSIFPAQHAPALGFMRWLITDQQCRMVNEYGQPFAAPD